MATVVTGLACSLSLQSAAYLQGLNAAAMATTNAANKMQRAFGTATAAANQTTAAVQRQAIAATRATQQMNTGVVALGKSVSSAANGLKGLFAATIVLQGVKAVAGYSDAWQEAGNKINAASQISGRAAASLEDVNKIALRTRSGIDVTAELYAKLLRSTATVAQSEEEVSLATEIVSKAFKAGGASVLEYEAGIRQLAQALGSGALQGDELRSIKENAPVLAQAIAEEFETTIGGLKKLGAEGALTTDRIFKAIIDHKDEVFGAFGATSATFADSMTALNNALTEYIGNINKSTGASGIFNSAIVDIANNLKPIIDNTPFGILARELHTLWGAGKEAAGTLGLLPDKIQAITDKAVAGITILGNYKSVLNSFNDLGGSMGGVETTSINDMFAKGTADRQDAKGLRVMGPEQGMDFEGIAKRAIEAEAAVSKLHSTQHDWATQVEVTDAGKLQADAYSHLAEYIKKTETPFETYKRTLAEVAILERDGALTTEQAFRERAMSSLTFANTALGAAGAMSGALTQLFKNNKAVAIANAVINTAEAITSALKNPPGPPFSYVYAAAAAVAGAAQIATIMSTNPGGGGKTPSVKSGGSKVAKASSAAPAAAGAASSTSSTTQTSVHITLEGEGGFSNDQVRSLIAQINSAVGDGATLKVSG